MKADLRDRFGRHHGLVSRSDALAAGLSYRQIRYRVATGLWIPVSPCVYRHAARPVRFELARFAAGQPGPGPRPASGGQLDPDSKDRTTFTSVVSRWYASRHEDSATVRV